MTQPVSRMRSSEVFSVSASCVCSMRTAASLSYATITPPIIMMRAATADNSFSRPLSFLRQFMASTRKGSSSWRARSASLRVKRRCSGSGASSWCWSSSSSAMRFRFGAIYARPRENRLKVCSSLMLTQSQHGVDARFIFFRASVRFSLASDKDHGARRGDKTGLVDAVAFLFFHDDGGDVGDQILVGGTFAQHGAQVVIVLAEKAGAEFAVGGQTDARAVAAERLRDWRDEADFAGGAIRETVFARGFAALVGNLHQRPARVNALLDFRGGDDEIARPVAVGIERHEFDETHDNAAVAGKFREGFDFIVIESADEDGVHFGGREARFLGGLDAVPDLGERFGTRDAFESGGVERIEADVDATETGGDEPVAALGEQVAVGGHGEVFDAESMQACDVVFDAVADERLTAGDTDFANAEVQEDASEAVELGPGKDLAVVAIVFRVGGAAVDAAEIAAVRDGDAQVGDLPAEFVVKGHGLPQYFDAAPQVSGARSPENKTARSIAWNRAQTKKYIFSSVAPFQAGGLGVSTQTLSPESSRDVAPVAVGCLSRRPQRSELQR